VSDDSIKRRDPVDIDKEDVQALFNASPYVEWSPFAKSQGWAPQASRNKYPVHLWIREKKRAIAEAEAEKISQALFDHRSAWHQDVLTTLREYPATNDAMLGILKRRMNDIIEDVNSDVEERKAASQEGRAPFSGGKKRQFDKWQTDELRALSQAIKSITESKYRSLMLNDWTAKKADEATNPQMLGAPPEEAQASKDEWVVGLVGGQELSTKSVQDLMDRYLDKPGALGGAVQPISAIVQAAAQEGLDLPLSELQEEEEA
jgi:hypothetical protein